MNSAPDAILHYVLSRISNARDLARCSCVAKRWRDCVLYLPALYFPRNAFDGLPQPQADLAITHFVTRAALLEELVLYCPFSAPLLATWLALKAPSLRRLELRVDGPAQLDCLGWSRGLESLKLWGVCMGAPPRWEPFIALRTVEIVGGAFRDSALVAALAACPNLAQLALLGCDGVGSLCLELELLESCRLDFIGPRGRTLSVGCPNLRSLEVQGFSSVILKQAGLLQSLSIAKTSGKMETVEAEKLPALEFLSLRGVQWSWAAVSSALDCAAEVRRLVMKIEFCGDFDRFLPFPPVDLVQFFNAHPRLQIFEIHGAMFAALCQKDSLQSVDFRFWIPSLEEVVVTVRSPLNAEQKLSTLESLVKHSPRLRRMVIRVSQMKNCNEMADDFFEDICRFRSMNSNKIQVE
ncbi:F-box/RNI-like superfamily protein isoform X1 [Wolffia australiana]